MAVATKLTNIGAYIPFGSGIGGVIALQALLEPEYTKKHKLAISMLEQGYAVQDIVETILEDDPTPELRQIQVLDVEGNQLSYTGEGIEKSSYTGLRRKTYAGHLYGDNVSVAGNILSDEDVLIAMISYYQAEKNTLSFPLLLLNSLKAGEEAGGNARKVYPPYLKPTSEHQLEEGYSCALLIFKVGTTNAIINLGQDNNPQPIDDLIQEVHNLCSA